MINSVDDHTSVSENIELELIWKKPPSRMSTDPIAAQCPCNYPNSRENIRGSARITRWERAGGYILACFQ